MQIKKTYHGVNPELLFDEVRDFVTKQGMVVDEEKIETYSLPSDSSTFISRGTLTFKAEGKTGKADKEYVRAHIVGSAKSEIKLIFDIDESLVSGKKVTALQDDLDFIVGSYEVKSTE